MKKIKFRIFLENLIKFLILVVIKFHFPKYKKFCFSYFASFFLKYKKIYFRENIKVFQAWGQKVHFPKYKKKFQSEFFYFSILENSLLKSFNLGARKFHFLKYKSSIFPKYKKNFSLRKHKKLFQSGFFYLVMLFPIFQARAVTYLQPQACNFI